jgi:hypothetical protein
MSRNIIFVYFSCLKSQNLLHNDLSFLPEFIDRSILRFFNHLVDMRRFTEVSNAVSFTTDSTGHSKDLIA